MKFKIKRDEKAWVVIEPSGEVTWRCLSWQDAMAWMNTLIRIGIAAKGAATSK